MDTWGVFFSLDFVRQYFVDIFSESPKSFFTINSGIAQFSTKRHINNRPSVTFYKDYWHQRTTQWVTFYGIREFFFSDFVMFFLHPQGDLLS